MLEPNFIEENDDEEGEQLDNASFSFETHKCSIGPSISDVPERGYFKHDKNITTLLTNPS